MSPGNYVALAVILFVIGAVGVLVRRNAMVIFMCIELMLNAVNLAFVAFARLHGLVDGQVDDEPARADDAEPDELLPVAAAAKRCAHARSRKRHAHIGLGRVHSRRA